MKLKGIITRVYLIKSQFYDSSELSNLVFIFRFKILPSDKRLTSLMLDTRDTDIINKLNPFVKKTASGTWLKNEIGCTPLLKVVPCEVDIITQKENANGKEIKAIYLKSLTILDM